MTLASPAIPMRSGFPRRVALLGALLLAVNAGAWAWAFVVFGANGALMGTALLAYAFGLRHGVDADHIASIDNVTRRLIGERKKPLAIGLYFSLGHSTIVVLACAAIALMSAALRVHFAGLRELRGMIGTCISIAFLLLIALANAATLAALYRSLRGRAADHAASPRGGPLNWLLAPLVKFISKPWHIFLLGLLFGLGFDTATEIGLLGISASQAAQTASPWTIMVFPALFTAGMALVDTADGVAMAGAYGWALIKPRRKLLYNFIITLLSVAIAAGIGAVEAAGLIAHRFALSLNWIDILDNHLGVVGGAIALALITFWLVSMLVYRMGAKLKM